MSFHSLARHLKISFTRRKRGIRRGAASRREKQPRPLLLETLEDRTVPSTVNWINPAGGDWDTPSNWSTGAVPGQADDVIISYSRIAVTHAGSAGDTVNSLQSQAAIALSAGTIEALGTSTSANSSGASMISGSITVAQGAYLDIRGPLTCTSTSSISGAGNVNFGDYFGPQGVANIQGHYNVSGTTSSTSGSLTFSGGRDSAGNLLDPSIGNLQLYNANATFQGDIGNVGDLNDTYTNGTYPSGTVNFEGNLASVGNITVDEQGVVNFQGSLGSNGSLTLSGGKANFSPSTPVTLTFPSLTVGSSSANSNFTGTLTGTDSFVVSGAFTWSGRSTVSGSGTLTAKGGLAISGDPNIPNVLDSRTLINTGARHIWR